MCFVHWETTKGAKIFIHMGWWYSTFESVWCFKNGLKCLKILIRFDIVTVIDIYILINLMHN